MALKIKNGQIVGTIDNLQDKLDGKFPIDRLELIKLINSWGRLYSFNTNNEINDIHSMNGIGLHEIKKSEAKECYDLSKLDTSQITNMDSIFKNSKFNGDISKWDVSSVTNMNSMFNGAYYFNQPLNSWDTSKVTNMESMFVCAISFNQPLNFDTSNVTNMRLMFSEARVFNQPIKFDTSSVVDMYGMFAHINEFNQPLNFDTSKVTNMNYMFANAKEFNQPLNFDTSKVIDMGNMFNCAFSFNQPLNFDTSNITNMNGLLNNANAFIEKYNEGNFLPTETKDIKEWLNNHREKTNEIKADTINSKLDNNKNEFEQLIKEKNIPIDSKLYKELLSVYNQTQDKLKNDLDELKSKVVDIATKDFANIYL